MRQTKMLHQAASSLQKPQSIDKLECASACFADVAR